jgi:hypothetical protein
MNLDALIHRKFPPITQQSDAKDAVDLQSSAIVFTARRLDHEVRVLDLVVCLKSVKSSPQEKRHH